MIEIEGMGQGIKYEKVAEKIADTLFSYLNSSFEFKAMMLCCYNAF